MGSVHALTDLSGQAAEMSAELDNGSDLVSTALADIGGIGGYLAQIAEASRFSGYYFLPDDVRHVEARLKSEGSAADIANLHRRAICHAVAAIDAGIVTARFPDETVDLYVEAASGILGGLNRKQDDYFTLSNDMYVKDLSICRLKLVPCGAEYIDDYSCIGRRVFLQGNPLSIPARIVSFALRARGFQGWFESHWDRRLVRQFTPEGYDNTYRLIAEMVTRRPDIRGMFGVCWWYDPAMDEFGPELTFLRTVPMDHGAMLYALESDASAIADATMMSPRRKQAYEDGEYVPTNHLLVWPRAGMLKLLQSRYG